MLVTPDTIQSSVLASLRGAADTMSWDVDYPETGKLDRNPNYADGKTRLGLDHMIQFFSEGLGNGLYPQLLGMVTGLNILDPVLDITTTLPEESGVGDRYILLSDKKIREWNGSAWTSYTPSDGDAVWVTQKSDMYWYDGSEWVSFTGDYFQAGDGLYRDQYTIHVGAGHGINVQDDLVDVDETELSHNLLGGLTTGDPHTQYPKLDDSETITGLWTFDRNPSAPFAVSAGSAHVPNLDADKLDGLDSTQFARSDVGDTIVGDWSMANAGEIQFRASTQAIWSNAAGELQLTAEDTIMWCLGDPCSEVMRLDAGGLVVSDHVSVSGGLDAHNIWTEQLFELIADDGVVVDSMLIKDGTCQISGATQDNFVSFDANAFLQDSAYSATSFAAASHGHALADLADYARGSLIVGTGADWAAVAKGTAGQIFMSDGTDLGWTTTFTADMLFSAGKKAYFEAAGAVAGTEWASSLNDTYFDLAHGAGGGLRIRDENNLLLTVSRIDGMTPTFTALTFPVVGMFVVGATLVCYFSDSDFNIEKSLAVTGDILVSGTVDTVDIAAFKSAFDALDYDDIAGDLDLVDIASYARGSLIVGGAADWVALAKGTAGQILISDGADLAYSTTFTADMLFAGSAKAYFDAAGAAGGEWIDSPGDDILGFYSGATFRFTGVAAVDITVPGSGTLQIAGDLFLIDNGSNPRLVLGDSPSAGDWGVIWWDSSSDSIGIGTQAGGVGTLLISEAGNVLLAGTGQFQFGDAGQHIYESAPTVLSYVSAGRHEFTGGPVYVGAGTPGHTITGSGDLYVADRLEVDGPAYFDDQTYFYGLMDCGNEHIMRFYGSTFGGLYRLAGDGLHFYVYGGAGSAQNRNIIICDYAARLDDYDHSALSANPTFIIHSLTRAASETDEWWSITHDVTDAVYAVGSGLHKFTGDMLSHTSGKHYFDAGAAAGTEYITSGADTFLDFHFADADAGARFYSGANLLLTIRRQATAVPTYTHIESPAQMYTYAGGEFRWYYANSQKMTLSTASVSFDNLGWFNLHADNMKMRFGAGFDAYIYFDGSNFIFDPDPVTAAAKVYIGVTADDPIHAGMFALGTTPDWSLTYSTDALYNVNSGVHKFTGGAVQIDEDIVMAEDGWIGIGAAVERLVFDGSAGYIYANNVAFVINQLNATFGAAAFTIEQSDVDQPYINFSGATEYTGKSGADEYLKIQTPSGVRYLKCYT